MESSSNASAPQCRLDFGPFSLLRYQRVLLRDGVPVRLGGRAFDILLALTERPGQLVSKKSLIDRVWPDTFVDEGSLRVHVAALRKAMGDSNGRLIHTDPGRGYRFTAPAVPIAVAAAPPMPPSASSLPCVATRLIGRDQFIHDLATKLTSRRFLTITGPGGIGKTSVAMACAHALTGAYRDGVAFLDLTKFVERDSVVAALAALLGAEGDGDPLRRLTRHLRDREMLLVIDNCEHVIGAAAALAETISTAAAGVHILATSREALRARGEWVSVLPPLASPPEDREEITADAALAYPAVELFVERAAAARFGYRLSDAEAPIVADICRRLGGVALAIEFVAAQLDAFGVRWLSAQLDDGLWLLRPGRRTAVPRHQTLVALLDWSYRLLSQREQATLQRVAAFPGAFTMAEAIGMTSGVGFDDTEVVGAVGGLVAKSLAMLDTGGPVARYRLTETTRTYVTAGFAGADRSRASYQ